MAGVWYQFVSRSQTTTCKERSCDWCGLRVVRLEGPPRSENDSGDFRASFPRGAFDGWSHYSRDLLKGPHAYTVDDPYIEVRLDFCAGCTTAIWDALIQGGWMQKLLVDAAAKRDTIYLDGLGRIVDSPAALDPKPMCIWRAEGRLGINPCRRPQGHVGECATNLDVGYSACPRSDCYRRGPPDLSQGQPYLLYTQLQLEHHAVVEHGCFRNNDGMWTWGRGGPSLYPSAFEVLDSAPPRLA